MFGFDLFGRKKKDEQFMRQLMVAARVGKARQFIKKVAANNGIDIGDYSTIEQISCNVAAIIVNAAMNVNGWSNESVTREQRFGAILTLMLAANFISQSAEIDFTLLVRGAMLMLFGPDKSVELYKDVDDALEAMNSFSKNPRNNEFIVAVGRNMNEWMESQDQDAMSMIARGMATFAQATET